MQYSSGPDQRNFLSESLDPFLLQISSFSATVCFKRMLAFSKPCLVKVDFLLELGSLLAASPFQTSRVRDPGILNALYSRVLQLIHPCSSNGSLSFQN